MDKRKGKIIKIFPTTTLSGGFEKRLFWLEESAEEEKYPNTFQFECWKSDCVMLDNYVEGDKVTVFFDLKGKKFEGRDKENKIMTTLKAWNIEKDGKLFKKIN